MTSGRLLSALALITISNRRPTGMSRYCIFTLKHNGRPNFSTPIITAARAVPIILPLPPVIRVPPKTTAVIIGRVIVAPRSLFAVPRYEVRRIPETAVEI